MDWIAKYDTQTVTLERRERDANGDPVGNQFEGESYGAPVTIQGIYQPVSGTVRTAMGASVQAEGQLNTATEVKLGDKINGSIVKRVNPLIYFDGVTYRYDVFF